MQWVSEKRDINQREEGGKCEKRIENVGKVKKLIRVKVQLNELENS